jgi:hypothetical protein
VDYFLLCLRGDVMKLADLLSKDEKKQLNNIKSPKKIKHQKSKTKPKPKPKKEERVNWHDIMGTNKQVLKRGKGGAWR